MSPDQRRLPIVEAIRSYLGVGRIHMPGHKGGTGVAEPFLRLLGTGAFQADVVGVEGLDDFHSPSGCIAEAQSLAAKAWGADRTFFLVNGASGGLHALILALCGPDDELIIPRTVHRSVVGGLIQSGARPVYMEPDIDETFGLALGVLPATVEKAIAAHPGARGVLIVSPTYYGVVSDVDAIANIAHARGLPLVVDEAHGAHLGFHPHLPPSSIQQGGADAVVQGTHKTAGSLSQGAMLHLRGSRVPVDGVRRYLQLLQTTSPSYLILGSLDAARFLLATEGACRLEQALDFARRITADVEVMEQVGAGVRRLRLDFSRGPFCNDPTRIVVNVRESGLSGYQVERALRRKHGVQIELADSANIVLLLSVGDTPETIEAFLTAFRHVIADAAGTTVPALPAAPTGGPLPPTPPMVLSPALAFRQPTRRVRLDEATGLVSGEMIAAYPPGIPVVYPGERLTPEVIAYLSEARAAGVHLQGAADGRLDFIHVID